MRLDEDELARWGARIGEEVETPVLIALEGPLGSGKSVLARAIGAGAGVRVPMPSPTFNLLFRYEGRAGRHVVHMDLYRLDDPEELWELGWSERGAPGEIALVEWPHRAADRLPAHRWSVVLSIPEGEAGLRDVGVRRVGTPPELPGFPISVST